MNDLKTLYLIDASIPFFRYYFSMPDNWVSHNGHSTSAVYGFTHWLKRFLQQTKPKYIVACFDESLGTCFRNEIYPDYKASRPFPDGNILYQMEACKVITQYMGVPAYTSNRYEADDLIGTIAAKNAKQGGMNIVVSGDKDLIQVIRPGDGYWNYPHDVCLDYNACIHKVGVRPEQLSDYLALVGDRSDDIPGVPGIGPITARALLKRFGSIAEIMANLAVLRELDIRGAKQLDQKLLTYVEQIAMAQKLTKICTKATLNRRCQLKRKTAQLHKLQIYAESMGFNLRSIYL